MLELLLNKIREHEYNIAVNSLIVDYIDTFINDINALQQLKTLLDEKSHISYDEFDRGSLYFSKLFLERRINNLDFEHKLRIQRTNNNIRFAEL